MTASLTNDGSHILDEKIDIYTKEEVTEEEFEYYFSIKYVAQLIKENKYKSIALQFPDNLLQYASRIVFSLRSHLGVNLNPIENIIAPENQRKRESIISTKAKVTDIEDILQSKQKKSEVNIDMDANDSNTAPRIFILADTTFGSCCIDEIAALKAHADFLVHYGVACLQKVSRIPVHHVFGKRRGLDMKKCLEELQKYAKHTSDTASTSGSDNDTTETTEAQSNQEQTQSTPTSRIVVVYDLNLAHIIGDLLKGDTTNDTEDTKDTFQIEIATLDPNRVTQHINDDKMDGIDANLLSEDEKEVSNKVKDEQDEEYLYGLRFHLTKNTKFYYVGNDETFLTHLIMQYNDHSFIQYDVNKNAIKNAISVRRTLSRRYVLSEKAKSAKQIGILIATVTATKYLEMVQYVKDIIKKAGRKYYTFFVGKLNVPKLANFNQIDIFVMVSCGRTSLVDSREYFKPIITPFELDVALNRDWDGSYVFGMKLLDEKILEKHLKERKERDVVYSFYSKTLEKVSAERNSKKMDGSSASEGGTKDIVEREKSGELVKSSGINFLKNMTFRGLETKIGETPVQEGILKGRSGIAKGYDDEVS